MLDIIDPDEIQTDDPKDKKSAASTGQASSFSGIPDPDSIQVDLPSPDEDTQEKPGYVRSIYNLSRRILAMAGMGAPQDIQEVSKMMQKNIEFSPENAMIGEQVTSDLKNFFSKVSLKGTKDALHSIGSTIANDPVGTIASLPMGLVHMFVNNPINVVLGADATENELKQQSAEQGSTEIKALLGTAAGLLVGGGASRLLGEAALARSGAVYGLDRAATKAALSGDLAPAIASADSRALVNATQQSANALGKIGRRIVDGTLEGAAFGAAQSAVAGAGKEDVAAQMLLNGVVFAPLGAATEFMRLKAGNPADALLHSVAKDVAYTRQIQASLNRSLDEALNTATGVLESDNIITGIARGNLKTNPKAITILRNVEPSRLTEKFPDDLEVSLHARENGNLDVMIVNKQNEIFAGREIPQDPRGKLVDRKKDDKGNFVPQVGDRVVSATPDGDYVSGTVVTFEGKGGVEKTVRLDAKGKPVESESQMKELWVRKDPNINAEGQAVPFQMTKEHERLDPEKWYVDPDQISKGVDYGKIYKANKATTNERAFLHGYFKVNGELPQTARIVGTREVVGYNGQDFFVKSIDTEKGKALLTSPRAGSLGGIEVPLEDVRLRETAVHQFEPKEYYDTIYNQSRESLGKKPFGAVVAEIADKFGIKDDAVRPLIREIGSRYMKEIEASNGGTATEKFSEVQSFMQNHNEMLKHDINATHEKLVRAANTNGMYIEDIGTGIQLRNTETGELLPFSGSTPSEAIKFINESGQVDGVDLDGASPVPTNMIGGVTEAPASLADPGTQKSLMEVVGASRGGRMDRVRAWFQAREVAHPWLADMRAFIAGMDEAHGTNLLPAYTRAQDASLKMEAQAKKLYARFDPVMRELASTFKSADEMTLAARAMETRSAADMELRFFGSRGLSTGEKSVGKFISDNVIDETRVLKYRTELENLKSKVFAHQERDLGNTTQLTKQAPNAEVLASIEKAIKDARAEIAARYQPEFDALNQKYNLTKVERELYEKFQSIASGDLSEASIYGAVRYGRALKDPLVHGLSQADFFDKHKFDASQRRAIAHAEKAYDELGDEFGIPEFRRINGYMNHMKRLGEEARPSDIMKFSSHLDNPGVARFMSDLYRTGENDAVFNHDIVEAMRGYIRGGVKARTLFPEIHGQLINGKAHGGVKEQFEVELNRLPENVRDVAFRRLREYIESLSGRMPLADAVVREGVARSFEKLGLDVTSKPIDTGTKTASILNLINASYTGGKIYQGLRDITDVTAKYYIKYGRERAQKFISIGVKDVDVAGLIDKGIIRQVDKTTFVQPVESSIYAKANTAKGKLEDILFKMTLQDKVFGRAQAAAYYEGKSLAREVFNKVLDKKMTHEEAVTALSLRQFEDGVTAEAGRLLEAHGSEAAAEFYAKQNVRSVVGLFGHGEQPSGFNTKAGRILGQYGIYPISTRRFVMDVATRGTPKEIAGAMARYAASQGALLTAGAALGFNMGRWIMTPGSLVFTGGPLLQFAGNVGTMTGVLGGDEAAQRMAYNNFKQAFPSLSDPRSMFLPGSYAAYDIMRGFELLQNGEAKGAASILGIPMSKDANFIETGVISAPYAAEKFAEDLWKKNGGN